MAGSLLIGYVRALVRGPDIDWQYAQLKAAGVTDRLTYADGLPTRKGDPRRMFGEVCRAMRSGDCLVVPSLAIFARNRNEVIQGMQALELRRAAFFSVADQIDTRQADPDLLFKLGSALSRAAYIWKREQTVAGCEAARRTRKTGRRPKLSPKRREIVRAMWLDPENEQTNAELAKLVGLSPSRLHALFGARGRA